MENSINNNSTFEILTESFEIPNLQLMFTKEQVTQLILKFGLENKVSLRETLDFINTKI